MPYYIHINTTYITKPHNWHPALSYLVPKSKVLEKIVNGFTMFFVEYIVQNVKLIE